MIRNMAHSASLLQTPFVRRKVAQMKKATRSPFVLTLALAVGLLVQVFAGPVAGVIGAIAGAAAGSAIVRQHPEKY